MLGRLANRKEAQLKEIGDLGCVPRGVCLLGRDGASVSFSPVMVLSLAFETPCNHVLGIHLMLHR